MYDGKSSYHSINCKAFHICGILNKEHEEKKGMRPLKFLKNTIIILLVIGIILGGSYVIWTLIMPDNWESKLQTALDTPKDSGITGEAYDDFDVTYYPYYNFLSTEGKRLYGQVYANALAYETSFVPVVELSVSEVSNVVKTVFHDHPELFWMDSGFTYKYTKDNICTHIVLQFNETVGYIEKAQKEFHEKANSIIDGASMLSSDYEKEKYVYNAIIAIAEYDEQATVNQSPYSALVNGKSVCAGYARAFQYIMIELGIPTYYCAGMSEGHAWNIVKLENGYYNVDLTWDDEKGTEKTYFNRTDDSLGRSHNRSGYSVLLPKCNATQYAKTQ